ncbi:TetR/AcrR family transcriptional regulator [Nocardia sp. NPDC020380]|uniref:TetR/AcrR family transcriptional regulator n=1 Tax=Nocardia sp. NPDC020380 TaxID=3364309 RepID=UPI003799FF69
MASKTYHHGALRQALIDETKAILAERGHDQFSLNEVARRLGVSSAAPYRHFTNREELLTAVATEGYDLLYRALQPAAGGTGDPRERLLRMGGAYVRFAHDHRELFMTMFHDRHGSTPLGGESFDLLIAAVAAAQQAKVLPGNASPELMARSVWAALHGLAELVLRRPGKRFGFDAPPEELAVTTLTTLLQLEP